MIKLDKDYVRHGTPIYDEITRLWGYTPTAEILIGVLSGYPLCCVKFYCDHWMHFWDDVPRTAEGTRQGRANADAAWPHVKLHHVGYAPCPECSDRLLAEREKKA